LSDQVKSLDWRARGTKRIGKAPVSVVDEVLGKLGTVVTFGRRG
jgi:mRNA-degrading endonuclease toxin of MazEF toxin-antitoxin module